MSQLISKSIKVKWKALQISAVIEHFWILQLNEVAALAADSLVLALE